MRLIASILAVGLAAGVGIAIGQQAAQQSSASKDKDKVKAKDDDSPFKGARITTKSSGTQKKESATLAFSGVGPNGEPLDISRQASAADTEKARSLTAKRPAPELLAAFIKEGELKSR